ncbi:FAD-binding domain-containing protein [Rhizodiscina lignyota]|uniref:FAD-binding domain-containing protein n=1 Tax=Rhizodiscina lignyota TaxID=1504668 RepID=A0A9P4M353_9PEZI|nr:FAD-binding domain-containing protein [Rhizodiscina lignyota]
MTSSINTFAATLPQSTFLPDSSEYQGASKYWTDTVFLKPGAVFIPNSAEELAKGLEQLVEHQISFSIKGGGHNANRGWASNSDGGVVISTSNLKGLELIETGSEGGTVLRTNIGITLTEIYDFLEEKGTTIAAGNQATPGLGGLLLGGGLSPYWNRFGFAANTIVSFQVVTADSKILDVTAKSHPDLFWALKGGICNFGIVTRLDLKTFARQNIWAGAHIFAPTSFGAAFDALDSFTTEEGNSPHVGVMLMSPAKGMVMASLFYDGPHDSDEPPPVFRHFNALPMVNSTFKKSSWPGVVKFSFMVAPYGFRRYVSTSTIYKDTKLLQRLFELYQSSAQEHLSDIEGGEFHIFANVMTVAAFEKNRDGPWAIDNLKEDIVGMMQWSTWKHAKDDERVMRWTEMISDEMKRVAEAEGKSHKYLYINNANETQDAFASWEPRNMDQMREISKKYDPNAVFQKLRSGGPKLWS